MPYTVFFDIDSTLVENRFSRRAIGDTLESIAQVAQKPVRELARELGAINEQRQQSTPDDVRTMDWRDIIAELADRYGTAPTRDLNALWEAYANADEIDVLDNAHSVLDALKAQGHRLVIATKGLWWYQEPVMRVTGLLRYFDDVLTPDKTGYLKTTPTYFHAYKRAHPSPRYVQVGDHYYDDVICAKRNGFFAIMRAPIAELAPLPADERPRQLEAHRQHIPTYPAQGTDILPDRVVISLEEVPSLLEELMRR